MTIRSIDVGQVPNDGTGDDLREAFVKVNENFTELDNRTGTDPFAINTLSGVGESLFAFKSDNTFNFKSIEGRNNVSVSSNSSTVFIDANGGIDGILVIGDEGSITLDDSKAFYLQGSSTDSSSPIIRTRVENGNSIFIDLQNSGIVEYDINPTLGQSLDANFKNINNVSVLSAATIDADLQGSVNGMPVEELTGYFDNYWNFGGIYPENFKNIIDYLNFTQDVDMGSINDPAEFSINGGVI